MRYVTKEDIKIFDESFKLREEMDRLHKEWLEQVKKHHRGEMSYKDTKPKYDEYIEAGDKWKKFNQENAEILMFEKD